MLKGSTVALVRLSSPVVTQVVPRSGTGVLTVGTINQ